MSIPNPNLQIALTKNVAVALYVIYGESAIKQVSHKYIKFMRLDKAKKVITCYCDFIAVKLTIEFIIDDDDIYTISNRL